MPRTWKNCQILYLTLESDDVMKCYYCQTLLAVTCILYHWVLSHGVCCKQDLIKGLEKNKFVLDKSNFE